MSKTENRLSSQGESNDCDRTPVAATNTINDHSASSPQQGKDQDNEQQQSLAASVNQPAVSSYLSPDYYQEVYPTLKLRLGHSQLMPDAWQQKQEQEQQTPAVEKSRQSGGRSKSPTARKPLQAVTRPRRIPTDPLEHLNQLGNNILTSNNNSSISSSSSSSTGNSSNNCSSTSSTNSSCSVRDTACIWSNMQLQEQQQQQQQHYNSYSSYSNNTQQGRPNGRNGRSSNEIGHHLTFEQWLVSKKKLDAQRRRQNRREIHRQTHQQQVRKQMSEKCYADWLSSKRQRRSTAGGLTEETKTTKRRLPSILISTPGSRREETQRCVEQWERSKLQELERRREQQLHEQQDQLVRDQLRRQLSQLAWQRWLQQLEIRPKFISMSPSSPPASPVSTHQLRKTQSAAVPQPQRSRHVPSLKELKLQDQLQSLYLHVPLSTAQRSLRKRLDSLDGIQMQRKRK